MLQATDKRKIRKKDFEYDLYKKHGVTQYRPYDEINRETHIATRLYLYYKNDVHIGTWCKGEGWEFVEAH